MKNKKIFKIIKKILTVLVVIFVLLFLLVVCLQKFSDNKISFLNFRLFTVVSGSMVPRYNIGDVLVAKEVDPSKIKIGDDISYLGETGTFKGKIVTHEVVDIEQDEEGNYVFHTKGLANIVEDPIVYEHQLYGVIIHKMIILSFIYKIVATPIGLFALVIIPVLYIIGSEMLSFMLAKEEERRSKK